MFEVRFLDDGSFDFEKVYSYGKDDSISSLSVNPFLLVDPEMGLKWAYRHRRIT